LEKEGSQRIALKTAQADCALRRPQFPSNV
jgi:hypothetical protein